MSSLTFAVMVVVLGLTQGTSHLHLLQLQLLFLDHTCTVLLIAHHHLEVSVGGLILLLCYSRWRIRRRFFQFYRFAPSFASAWRWWTWWWQTWDGWRSRRAWRNYPTDAEPAFVQRACCRLPEA